MITISGLKINHDHIKRLSVLDLSLVEFYILKSCFVENVKNVENVGKETSTNDVIRYVVT